MKYFGTDGIRGNAEEFLTSELAFRVGTSLSTLDEKTVVIGRDTRKSGKMLADGIASGANSVGLDTIDAGIVSTPELSYLSGQFHATGVMITASHNPFQDNGIKVFKAGTKLFAKEEQDLEDILNGVAAPQKSPILGQRLPSLDPLALYSRLFDGFLPISKMKIALDLAHGATIVTGPAIFHRITPNLELTGNAPDGQNINEGVGSTHIDHLVSVVKDHHCDIGFAFDGDGDRLMAVDGTGKVYDGDMLMYVIAVYLKERGLLQQNQVVLTQMSNLGIIKAFERRGISVLTAEIGDKNVLEALQTNDLTIGGENSGHIINCRLLNTGDGVLNAAYVVKILEEASSSLAELTKDLFLYPDKLINLRNIDKTLVNHPDVVALVAQWKERLGNEGKILVRASGTEPLIRVSVSAASEAVLDDCQQQIIKVFERLDVLQPNK